MLLRTVGVLWDLNGSARYGASQSRRMHVALSNLALLLLTPRNPAPPTIMSSSSSATTKLRAVIVPGNGDGDIEHSNWYAWIAGKLRNDERFDEVVLKNMPDPIRARRDIWLPFMRTEMGCDPRTVVIGHSSGAVAAMRLLETDKLHGAVLVSACHTDLGDANERASGYYPPSGGPWQYEAMMANAGGNVRAAHVDSLVLQSNNDPSVRLSLV